MKPLDSILEPSRGITYGVVKPGEEDPDGVLFVRGGDLSAGKVALSALRTISPSVSAIYKRTILKGGELLVSLVGNPGEVAIAPPSLAEANIARQVGLIPLNQSIDARFIMYFLMSPRGRAEIFTRTGGAVQQVINLADIRTIEVPVPDYSTQNRIASILTAYDDLIENNRRRMALLEESARLLYREWFVHLRFPGHESTRIVDGLPVGWESMVLGDLCSDIRNAVSPDEVDAETPYIGLEHMPRRSIALGEWETAGKVTSNKFRFAEGEILFGKIRPYFHKVGITFVDGIASSDAIVIRPHRAEWRALVLMTVSSDPFVAQASQGMKEGSKMPRADWKQLIRFPVLLPPPPLLNHFSLVISSITEQLKTLTFQNQKLKTARDLLLPKLMSGEIAV